MSESRFPTPAWAQEVMEKYGSGVAHAFVLHFNIHDYAVPGVPFTTYLAQMLAGRQVVAVYSRDLGITFPLETMRERFIEILGLGDGQPQQPADPALAALQSLGVAPAGGGTELPRAPADALPLLGQLLRTGGPEDKLAAVVIEEAQTVVPDADVAAMSPADRDVLVAVSRWGRDAKVVAAGNPVFLVTPNLSALNGAVRAASSKWEAVKVSLPGPQERLAFIRWYLEERPDTFAWPDEMTPQMLANVTAGLSLVHLEDILLRAEAEGELRPEMVRERKEAIIRSEYGDVLEVMEPRFGFDDIGGLAHVKEFFTRSVIRPMREGRTRRVPQGVLLTGPAGTGKSVIAEAIAREADINAVRLRIGGQIASKWQGEGERNLEKALAAIEGLQPCLVFIDEVDQAVSRGAGGGGSQQDRRIFQRLLEWMSDVGHRGRSLVLGATNRPDLMDAALRRPGRFDKKIPFLVPGEEERRAILAVMCRRYGLQVEHIPDGCVAATDGWTGAEIEAAAVKAAELVEDENLEPAEALIQAVQRIRPSTADIEFMTLLSIAECNDRDLLPPRYRALLDDREGLQKKLEAARPAEARRGRREL
jgi:transitional endoplasmic reticulum ATPase